MRFDEKLTDPVSLPDEALIRALRDGNEKAAPILVERYRPLIASLAAGFGGADTEDLVQEGLISLISAAYAYREDGAAAFKTYLAVCVTNRMKTVVKRERTDKRAPQGAVVPLEELELPGGEDPEDVVLSDEACLDLYRLFDAALSKLERRVLLEHLAGLSNAAVAEKLGVSEKSAENALSRARAKLKAALSK